MRRKYEPPSDHTAEGLLPPSLSFTNTVFMDALPLSPIYSPSFSSTPSPPVALFSCRLLCSDRGHCVMTHTQTFAIVFKLK